MFRQTGAGGRDTTMMYPEPDFAVQLREDLPPEDTRHVLSLFSGDLQRLTAAIQAAAEAAQGPALRRAAHALAGAAGAVGANALEQTCRAVMKAATDTQADLLANFQAIEAASVAAGLALERVQRELAADAASLPRGMA